jgi:alpha-glucuronidase
MLLSLLLVTIIGFTAAEDGRSAWLRYAPVPDASSYGSLPSIIVALNSTKSSPVYTAGQELQQGIKGILGKQLSVSANRTGDEPAIIVSTFDAYTKIDRGFDGSGLDKDGFYLSTKGQNVVIVGSNERGALYGAFEYLSRLAQSKFDETTTVDNPEAPIRWVNQWDNLDGSIERGYAGPSIIFRNGFVVDDVARVAESCCPCIVCEPWC